MSVGRRAGKKIASLVLCLVVLVASLTGCESFLSLDKHEYTYVTSSQQLFDALNKALYSFEEEVYVRTKTYDDFRTMWDELNGAFSLHTCFREKEFQVRYNQRDYYCNIIIEMNLNTTGEAMQVLYAKNRENYRTQEAREIGEALLDIQDRIIQEGMSEEEIVLEIHDYIISTYAYAVNGDIERFSRAGVLLSDGVGQCQAYSELFVCLCLLSGVEAEVITGHSTFGHNEVGHAWNLVKIGSSWYHVDVTWDDPVPDVKGMIRYDYFLKGDFSLRESHEWAEFFRRCYSDYVS